MPSWRGLGSPVCIPNWSKDACSGLAMYMYTIVYVDDDGCLANNCPRGRLQLHSRPSSSVWIAGRLRPQSVWSVETSSEDKQWRKASPGLGQCLPSNPRRRGIEWKVKAREGDHQSLSTFAIKRTAFPTLICPASPGTVPLPPFRAQMHANQSLRLTDANYVIAC